MAFFFSGIFYPGNRPRSLTSTTNRRFSVFIHFKNVFKYIPYTLWGHILLYYLHVWLLRPGLMRKNIKICVSISPKMVACHKNGNSLKVFFGFAEQFIGCQTFATKTLHRCIYLSYSLRIFLNKCKLGSEADYDRIENIPAIQLASQAIFLDDQLTKVPTTYGWPFNG